MSISKHKRCFNVKSSTCYFRVKMKILTDFQFCISIPNYIQIYYCKNTWNNNRIYTWILTLLTLRDFSQTLRSWVWYWFSVGSSDIALGFFISKIITCQYRFQEKKKRKIKGFWSLAPQKKLKMVLFWIIDQKICKFHIHQVINQKWLN